MKMAGLSVACCDCVFSVMRGLVKIGDLVCAPVCSRIATGMEGIYFGREVCSMSAILTRSGRVLAPSFFMTLCR
jgi:hypothetical protein